MPNDRHSVELFKNPDFRTSAARGEASPRLPERSAPPRARRCSSARWRGRARRAGDVDVDVHRGQPVTRPARRIAPFEKGDNPALLDAGRIPSWIFRVLTSGSTPTPHIAGL